MSDRGTALKRRRGVADVAALCAYPMKPPPGAAPVYDWTGFYFGANGGGSWGQTNWESDPDGGISGTVKGATGLFGGTMGYNAQNLGGMLGPLVVGEEFDFDWRPYKFVVPPASCAPGCELKSPWLSTMRLRLGYSLDRFMPYATGGVSMSNFTADIIGQPFGSNNYTTFNWTAGAGVEFMVTGQLSAKVEYLFVNNTRTGCFAQCGGGAINMGLSENIFRAGLNYRFGGW
jgi:outer membrane immunogenic protein